MKIPAKFAVDFSSYRKDLIVQAINRLLGQHYDKCTLKQFILAVMGEVQCLYDALIDLQEQRTLYRAEGETLSALGRIVGQERAPMQYAETYFMYADRPMQAPDAVGAWSRYALLGRFVPSDEDGYQYTILSKIVKNHTLVASVPELQRLIYMITEEHVSFDKTGPMQMTILVPAGLSATAWHILTQAVSDRRADDRFMLPYPVTLWFYTLIVFLPERPENLNWLCADRTNIQRCDRAPCAVGVPFYPPEMNDKWVQPDPDSAGTATIYLPAVWLCADRKNEQRPDNAQCAVGVPYRRGGYQ